jgi:hypothetical protein
LPTNQEPYGKAKHEDRYGDGQNDAERSEGQSHPDNLIEQLRKPENKKQKKTINFFYESEGDGKMLFVINVS